jgi:hypothetical protein
VWCPQQTCHQFLFLFRCWRLKQNHVFHPNTSLSTFCFCSGYQTIHAVRASA